MRLKELASALGVSAATVTRDAAIGMPTHSVDAARAWRREHRRPRHRAVESTPPPAALPPSASASPAASDERISYDEARRRQAVAEALMAEREQRRQAGELVEVAAVRTALARRVVALREAVLQVPARLAPVLAAESEVAAVHNALQAELHAVLAQVSEWRAT